MVGEQRISSARTSAERTDHPSYILGVTVSSAGRLVGGESQSSSLGIFIIMRTCRLIWSWSWTVISGSRTDSQI